MGRLGRREVSERGQRGGSCGMGLELGDLSFGLSLTCCVILDNLLKLSEMPFPHLYSNEMVHVTLLR